MGAFLIYPIITMVIDSFYNIGITGEKTWIGMENYIRAFTAGGFLKQLKNTLVYIVLAVGMETVIGLMFALFFELNYRGSKIIRSLMMAPLMIAPLVAGLTWKLMMSSSFGIVNELLTRVGILANSSDILWLADAKWSLIACCIADIWLTTPFMMLMTLAGLQGLDSSMLEAAKIDGAGPIRRFFAITVPTISPTTFYLLVMGVIGGLQSFTWFQIICDPIAASGYGWGPGDSGITIVYYVYNKAFATSTGLIQGGVAAAAAWVLALGILVLTVLNFKLSKYWVHYDS